jgi:hypothetical protein
VAFTASDVWIEASPVRLVTIGDNRDFLLRKWKWAFEPRFKNQVITGIRKQDFRYWAGKT